jgi:hypothetical protein
MTSAWLQRQKTQFIRKNLMFVVFFVKIKELGEKIVPCAKVYTVLVG